MKALLIQQRCQCKSPLNYIPRARGENTFPLTLALHALFARLWKLGYRVVFKEVNGGDTACAEFVVYRFFSDA
jgi:hypothetical protein